ncbi:MAG: hypothetical protein QNJ32_03765 [Xenococcaceae cyanobacterium MO_167.B27]|nr:hypothetical protein [Xenococcaceae cyanobacterium MO_167.B27]
MNIEQTIKDKSQESNSEPKPTKKIKQFTPEEEQYFINSLMVDDDNDWSEEDEIKYQRVMRRLQR